MDKIEYQDSYSTLIYDAAKPGVWASSYHIKACALALDTSIFIYNSSKNFREILLTTDPEELNRHFLNNDIDIRMHTIYDNDQKNEQKIPLMIYYNDFHFTAILRKNLNHLNYFIPNTIDGKKEHIMLPFLDEDSANHIEEMEI